MTFNRSPSCPQCRKSCYSSQLKRIYINFASGDELASALLMSSLPQPQSNSNAEETIEMLLEHLEMPQQQQNAQECEYCKMFQEALECTQTEKDRLAHSLHSKEQENHTLFQEIENSAKRIEMLEIGTRANEHNLKVMKERLDTSEASSSAIQMENTQNRDTIHNLQMNISRRDNELKEKLKQMENLNEKLNSMAIKHNQCNKLSVEQSLENKRCENINLVKSDDENALKCIDEFQPTVSANNDELEVLRKEVQSLNEKMQQISSKHATEIEEILQMNNFKLNNAPNIHRTDDLDSMLIQLLQP